MHYNEAPERTELSLMKQPSLPGHWASHAQLPLGAKERVLLDLQKHNSSARQTAIVQIMKYQTEPVGLEEGGEA